jgi:prepilin-type processing-associated H-X9-DG protein
LRNFHAGLSAFADANEGRFPEVAANGPNAFAGIFVPALTERGLAQDVSIGCPAHGTRAPLSQSLNELAELARTDPEKYESLAAQLAGDYAYCLGYEEGGRLYGLRQDSGDKLPVMADCAGTGGENSDNHGTAGQNVLFVGGHVRWCVRPTVGVDGDHIYVNRNNRVLAGVRRSDTVLGPSAARPFVGQ